MHLTLYKRALIATTFSVAKATLQSQMSVCLSVRLKSKPLRYQVNLLSDLPLQCIEPIDHQAYQLLSLSTIEPTNHQAY